MNKKTKLKYVVIISLSLAIYSCGLGTKQQKDILNKKAISNINEVSNQNKISDNSLEKYVINEDSCALIVKEFLDWYIKKELLTPTMSFSANIKKYPEGIWGLDISKLKADLTDFKFFSNGFIKAIIDKNEECNKVLLKNRITDPDDIYMNLSGNSEKYCNFLFFDNWLGGQDAIEVKDYRIIKNEKTKSNNNVLVFVETLTDTKDVYSLLTIEVTKDVSEYRINEIQADL